ncbi:MAG: type I-B CRISPR-associated protein Cas7/Cst2/DevR [Caldilineaceae bacterium]|nr:type I-B CRISPR-associated protein Cas7/Cst2/DevR [Caldilineaceae bacterium]
MPFVTGLLLIDAPASALNNAGTIPGSRTDNTVGVKAIRTRSGAYPYVSAQAFRYWLRTTLENGDFGWQAAPIYREEKVAYTDANPIRWWDDDLFGYMRAPSGRASAKERREADPTRKGETPTSDAVTRVSPFRMSTLVSIAPAMPTDDFGVMARQEGNPVPHEHQFYRTTLKGLFSLDLTACGRFSCRQKTGYRNLDDQRIEEAKRAGLEYSESDKSYVLPIQQRIERITALFEGIAHLDGGAKQTLHYTDVSPAVTFVAVTKGGNNIFGHVVGANAHGLPELQIDALAEALKVFKDDILSDIYIGWVKGYLRDERAKLEQAIQKGGALDASGLFNGRLEIHIAHPREILAQLIAEIKEHAHSGWLDQE